MINDTIPVTVCDDRRGAVRAAEDGGHGRVSWVRTRGGASERRRDDRLVEECGSPHLRQRQGVTGAGRLLIVSYDIVVVTGAWYHVLVHTWLRSPVPLQLDLKWSGKKPEL